MLSRVHKRVLLILTVPLLLAAGVVWIAINDLLDSPWNQSNTSFYAIAAVGVIAGTLWALIYVRRVGIRTALFSGILMSVACTGFGFMALPIVQFANSTLDFREARTVEAFVTDKWTERRAGKRSSWTVYLISIETPLEDQTRRTITVKHSMWDAVSKGSRARVRIGQGLLWPYVVAMEKVPQANSFPVSNDPEYTKDLFPLIIKDKK